MQHPHQGTFRLPRTNHSISPHLLLGAVPQHHKRYNHSISVNHSTTHHILSKVRVWYQLVMLSMRPAMLRNEQLFHSNTFHFHHHCCRCLHQAQQPTIRKSAPVRYQILSIFLHLLLPTRLLYHLKPLCPHRHTQRRIPRYNPCHL